MKSFEGKYELSVNEKLKITVAVMMLVINFLPFCYLLYYYCIYRGKGKR